MFAPKWVPGKGEILLRWVGTTATKDVAVNNVTLQLAINKADCDRAYCYTDVWSYTLGFLDTLFVIFRYWVFVVASIIEIQPRC